LVGNLTVKCSVLIPQGNWYNFDLFKIEFRIFYSVLAAIITAIVISQLLVVAAFASTQPNAVKAPAIERRPTRFHV